MGQLNMQFLHLNSSAQKSYQRFVATRYTQNDAGFSLIEIVAVVLMIGILAAIALPNFTAFVNRQKLNKANDFVLAALNQGKTEAKKRKLSYNISFTTVNQVIQVAVYPTGANPNSYWQSLGGDLKIADGAILLGTNITSPNTAGTSISYANAYDSTNQSQTITYDYLGTLTNANFGTIATGATEAPGLKIIVALAAGNSTTASSVKRCVIVKSLLGSQITAKDAQCN